MDKDDERTGSWHPLEQILWDSYWDRVGPSMVPDGYQDWHYVKLVGVTRGVGEFEGITPDGFSGLAARNCVVSTDAKALAEYLTGMDKELEGEEYERAVGRLEKIGRSLDSAIQAGHTSVAHVTFIFVFSCSIVALKQITRRRTGVQFAVKGGRYVSGKKQTRFHIPESILNNGDALELYLTYVGTGLKLAERLEDMGIPPEDARYSTPQSLMVDVVMAVNGEALLDWLRSRECFGTQAETRKVFQQILKQVRKVAPRTFAKAGASCLVDGFCPESRRRYESCPRRVSFPHRDDLLNIWKEKKAEQREVMASGERKA